MDICGEQSIFMPESECETCDLFLQELREVQDALENKQNKLTAGDNITFNGNTISASDTKYTAGAGISINGDVISNTGVTGVKGNAESTYRTGNVNLTTGNIGALSELTLAGYTNKGLGLADGSDIDPIRTTKGGLLPYDNTGTSYVGTTTLPFKQVCANKMLEWSALHNDYVSCSSGGTWLSSGAIAGYSTFVVPEKAKEVVVMVETPDQKAYNIRLVATTNDLIMSGYYLDANNAGSVAVTCGANRTVGLNNSYTKVVSGGTVYRRADMTFTVYYK